MTHKTLNDMFNKKNCINKTFRSMYTCMCKKTEREF